MSRDVNDLLQRTADEPTRPLDTAAVVGRARRQTRLARAGAGLGVIAVLALASLVALPMVTGDDPGLEIADGPDPVHGEDQVEADDNSATPSSELWGQTFTSVAVTDDGAIRALIEGTEVRLTFETGAPITDATGSEGGSEPTVDPAADGYLTWDAGCNHGSSQLRIQDGRLTLDGYGHHTYKLCGDEQTEQDSWLNDFLRASPRWAREGDQLVLSANETRIVLETADQPISGVDQMTVLEDAAAGDQALWPLRVVHERHYPAGYGAAGEPGGVAKWEFVGTSWNNWQVTQLAGSQAGQIVERKQGEREHFFTGDWDEADGELRAPSQDLSPYWHEPGWSLQEVALDALPAAADVLDRLGLAPAEVTAFASPAVINCRQEQIADCPETGRESVRALAHLDSGLLLYRQTVYEDEPMFTYVVTELSLSDSSAVPEHGPAG